MIHRTDNHNIGLIRQTVLNINNIFSSWKYASGIKTIVGTAITAGLNQVKPTSAMNYKRAVHTV